jgi:hypothetical protein
MVRAGQAAFLVNRKRTTRARHQACTTVLAAAPDGTDWMAASSSVQ